MQCIFCSQEILASTNIKFCSRECKALFYNREVKCSICNEIFNVWPSYLAKGNGIYCSVKCRAKSREMPILERLYGKISIDSSTLCWLWKGSLNSGYGRIRYNKKLIYVHIISWEHFYGEVPKGLCVLHKCDVRNCINPDHLFLGTHEDNNIDCMKKGRGVTKLKPEDILEIRALIAIGNKDKIIGELFNVRRQTIGDIRLGKRWSYI